MSSSRSDSALDRPVDVDALGLASGEAASLSGPVDLDPVILGGQGYRFVAGPDEALLDISAGASGVSFHLRLAGEAHGPCWRCATTTATAVTVDSWEYQENGRAETDDEDGLDCSYLREGLLDVRRWAWDAIVEALPDAIVCREDCKGICAGCGTDLNHGTCKCPDSGPDPRWDALRDIAAQLKDPK